MKKLIIILFVSLQVLISAADLQIITIDVGQADSHLIISPTGKSLLIDAGNKGDFEKIEATLKNNNISKLDCIILTHPDEDHIGGAAKVIETFKPGSVYMTNKKKTTMAFKNMLQAIKDIGRKITIPKPMDKITIEPGVTLNVFAPNASSYKETNNYSIVTKLEYNKFSMLFTGDAETESIDEMLQQKYNLKSDILKAGHHGSSNANNENFINAVQPQDVIISVGADNKYNHPSQEVITMFQQHKLNIYRTDKNGDIHISTNGKTYKIETER